jgi:hypothetical protein
MEKRQWTYQEITQEAERLIRVLQREAAPDNAGADPASIALREMARGCFLFWNCLTHEQRGDPHRLTWDRLNTLSFVRFGGLEDNLEKQLNVPLPSDNEPES